MVASVVRIYLCVRVFAVKIKGVKSEQVLLTYICVYEYVRVRNKKYLAAKYVCLLAECVCLYVWSDVDLHEKFSILKDGNILISIWLLTYFRLLYVLSFSATCLKLCVVNLWDQKATEKKEAKRAKKRELLSKP